jgi:hypothetical protein
MEDEDPCSKQISFLDLECHPDRRSYLLMSPPAWVGTSLCDSWMSISRCVVMVGYAGDVCSGCGCGVEGSVQVGAGSVSSMTWMGSGHRYFSVNTSPCNALIVVVMS